MSRADYSLPLAVLVNAHEVLSQVRKVPHGVPVPVELRNRVADVEGALAYWTERVTRSVDVEATVE